MASPPAANWARLRAYIDEKENYERITNAPAPLSTRELTAIAMLIPRFEEPDISDRNYVSALAELTQARKWAMPNYVDEAVNIPGSVTGNGWRCYCSLDPEHGRFPREDFGFIAGEAPPFEKKKSAKQYAAKQALAFFQPSSPTHAFAGPTGQAPPSYPSNHTSSGGSYPSPHNVNIGQPSVYPNHVNIAGPSSTASSSDQQQTPGSSSFPSSAPPSSQQPSFVPSSNQQPSLDPDFIPVPSYQIPSTDIVASVARLAPRMGMQPPLYHTEPQPEMPKFFKGWAEFSSDTRVPQDVGKVRDVLGKEEAKVQIAQSVYDYLLKELEARQELAKQLISRTSANE